MPKLTLVSTKQMSPQELSAYQEESSSDGTRLENLRPLLSGKRILHVSSTADGGGVAELLMSGCAFENALGLKSHWAVIEDTAPFFVITKKIHNGLQGETLTLTPTEQTAYRDIALSLHKDLEAILARLRTDIVILHDPQPLPLVSHVTQFAPALLRLHVDLSTPYKPIVDFLSPLIKEAASVIVSSDNYRAALEEYPAEHVAVIRPAIDPGTEKNRALDPSVAKDILTRHGIDTTRPFITQISRFDPWKDPLSAIAAYRIAKQSIPELQLVLTGFIEAADDPEALLWREKTKAAAGSDPDIRIFSDLSQLHGAITDSLLINAQNTLTNGTLQMSRREGFGLTITEAMWKERVVIARPSRGAQLQIVHGENGYIADTPEAVAKHIIDILADPVTAHRLGRAARASVAENFLLPHYIRLNCETYLKFL